MASTCCRRRGGEAIGKVGNAARGARDHDERCADDCDELSPARDRDLEASENAGEAARWLCAVCARGRAGLLNVIGAAGARGGGDFFADAGTSGEDVDVTLELRCRDAKVVAVRREKTGVPSSGPDTDLFVDTDALLDARLWPGIAPAEVTRRVCGGGGARNWPPFFKDSRFTNTGALAE